MGELSFNYYFYENIEITILLRVSLREQTFRPQKLIKFEMNFNQAKTCVKKFGAGFWL